MIRGLHHDDSEGKLSQLRILREGRRFFSRLPIWSLFAARFRAEELFFFTNSDDAFEIQLRFYGEFSLAVCQCDAFCRLAD